MDTRAMRGADIASDPQLVRSKIRSCLTNLLSVLEEISKWVYDGSQADVVYLNFQNAFDKVSHERLLLRLKARGAINCIDKWLTDRE